MMPVFGIGIFIVGIFIGEYHGGDAKEELISSLVMFIGMLIMVAWLLTSGERFAG